MRKRAGLVAGSSELMGEIAEYLSLQPGESCDPCRRPLERVLLPYAVSARGRQALEVSVELAMACGCSVHALHLQVYEVVRGSRWYLETPEEAEASAHDAVERLERRGVRCSSSLGKASRSDLARAIVRAAEDGGASMIVIGERSGCFPGGVWRPRLSRGVLRAARCPVLVVPVARPERARRSARLPVPGS